MKVFDRRARASQPTDPELEKYGLNATIAKRRLCRLDLVAS